MTTSPPMERWWIAAAAAAATVERSDVDPGGPVVLGPAQTGPQSRPNVRRRWSPADRRYESRPETLTKASRNASHLPTESAAINPATTKLEIIACIHENPLA